MAKNKTVRGTCTVSGCSRPHKLRGFCAAHAQRFRRGVTVDVPLRQRDMTPKEHCSEAECPLPVKAKGLCQTHYARLLRHGHTKYPARTKAPTSCTVRGCSNHMYANGLCNQHYLRERKMQAQFGLSLADLDAMLERQHGVCAICEKPPRAVNSISLRVVDFALDHDHSTGKPRGLLCPHCNRALGMFQDSPAILRRAAAYLEKHIT